MILPFLFAGLMLIVIGYAGWKAREIPDDHARSGQPQLRTPPADLRGDHRGRLRERK